MTKEENSDGEIVVQISGTKESIHQAKKLIFGCRVTFTGGKDVEGNSVFHSVLLETFLLS